MAKTECFEDTPMNRFKTRNHEITIEDIMRGDKQMFDREMFLRQLTAVKPNQLIKDICKQVAHEN